MLGVLEVHMNYEERIAFIEAMPAAVKQAILESESDEVVDVVAAANRAQSGIGTVKRSAASELSDGEQGRRYRFEQGRVAKRTYNTPRLVDKFGQAMSVSPWDAFVWLWRNDVIRLSWQYTNLIRAAADQDVSLTITPREIEEGDDADIGEYWRDASPQYRPIGEEDGGTGKKLFR